jgi:hypothetical protein
MESRPMERDLGNPKRSKRQELADYIELLRFGPRSCRSRGAVYATLAQISKMVKLSTTKI